MKKKSTTAVVVRKTDNDKALRMLADAEASIQKAETVQELKGLADKFETIRAWAKRSGASLPIQNRIAAYRLRCERKAGKLLRGIKPGPKRDGAKLAPILGCKTDNQAKHLSSRWQQQATVPETVFRKWLDTRMETDEITSQGLRRLAKEHTQQKEREGDQYETEKVESLSDIQGKFATIVIDPPWDYSEEGDDDVFGRTRPRYAQMCIDELRDKKKFPLQDLAEKNAHLYLWITNRSLPKGFPLVEHWGFRYVTMITWCKPSIGVGNYYRNNTEHILFGVRGSLALARHDIGTWFEAKRGPKGHSSKPWESYSMIESASPGPYLEIFGRQERENWTVWGVKS